MEMGSDHSCSVISFTIPVIKVHLGNNNKHSKEIWSDFPRKKKKLEKEKIRPVKACCKNTQKVGDIFCKISYITALCVFDLMKIQKTALLLLVIPSGSLHVINILGKSHQIPQY